LRTSSRALDLLAGMRIMRAQCDRSSRRSRLFGSLEIAIILDFYHRARSASSRRRRPIVGLAAVIEALVPPMGRGTQTWRSRTALVRVVAGDR
jgi:hypothetical protein